MSVQRHFDRAFKIETIKLVTDLGRSVPRWSPFPDIAYHS